MESAAPNPVRSRRSFFAGAFGGLLALTAGALGWPPRAEAAAGDPLILGSLANDAGTAETQLQINSAGTGLNVRQDGAGAAIRGTAVGVGAIAGLFTSGQGPALSGVTRRGDQYAIYASNDGGSSTQGGAIRAKTRNGNAVVATSAGQTMVVHATGAGGLAIDARNTAQEGELNAGTAIRGLTGVATADMLHPADGATWGPAAGEFAGPCGVIGLATDHGWGPGVLGITLADSPTAPPAMSAAIRGYTPLADAYAGRFDGKVHLTSFLQMESIEDPAGPSAWTQLFARTNAAGKIELCVRFRNASPQVIATEP